MDDMLRMPTRYVTAYHSEVRHHRSALASALASDLVPADCRRAAFTAAYYLLKRGLRAVGNLVDRGEQDGFNRHESSNLELLGQLRRMAGIESRYDPKRALTLTS